MSKLFPVPEHSPRGSDMPKSKKCVVGVPNEIKTHEYRVNGAEIVATAEDVWTNADLIVKVKEPLTVEWPLMRPGQVVFTFFHFAADDRLTRAVLASGITAI